MGLHTEWVCTGAVLNPLKGLQSVALDPSKRLVQGIAHGTPSEGGCMNLSKIGCMRLNMTPI